MLETGMSLGWTGRQWQGRSECYTARLGCALLCSDNGRGGVQQLIACLIER
jgi:hypothetical protein